MISDGTQSYSSGIPSRRIAEARDFSSTGTAGDLGHDASAQASGTSDSQCCHALDGSYRFLMSTTAVPHPSGTQSATWGAADGKARRENVLSEYMKAIGETATSMPTFVIIDEKPIHLAIAYMMVAGRTRKEIGDSTGLGTNMLSNLSKQPWFKDRIKQIADANGKDMVKAFLEGQVLTSLETLSTIRDDPGEKGATRVSAANSILDRYLGKPTTHIEAKSTLNIHTAAEAANQVESELEKIDRELRDRGVKIASRITSN